MEAKLDEIKAKIHEKECSESPFPKPAVKPDIEPPKKIEYVGKELTRIKKFIKQEGYVKKEEKPKHKDTKAEKMFKVAILSAISLMLFDIVIFFNNAVVDDVWCFTPTLWQILIISLFRDVSVGLVGKMIKYFEMDSELEELEVK